MTEIIILAVITLALGFKLYQLLGTQHTDEPRQNNPYTAPDAPQKSDEQSTKPALNLQEDGAQDESGFDQQPASRLAQIQRADPSFDPEHFMKGAGTAFHMIVTAFAEGDKESLRDLLSDEIYQVFSAEIDRRTAPQHVSILDPLDIEIVEASLFGNIASIQLKIRSVQEISNGDEREPEMIQRTDLWRFRRDIRDDNPNWVLAETH